MNLGDIILIHERSQSQKGHILYDSIYRKCSEQANVKRSKVDQWLLGVDGGGKRGRLSMSLFLSFFFLAMLGSMQDLSSQARDRTHALCSGI